MKNGVREGYHTLTPRLFVKDAAAYVQFLKAAFGAEGTYEHNMPSHITIGDTMLMVAEEGSRAATSSCFYFYTKDVDAMYRRAQQAGATSLEEPAEMPWGDRRGIVRDPFGNDWQIARYLG